MQQMEKGRLMERGTL